jgi:dihydrofolate reductase
MTKLIYANNVSLDGFCEDASGEYNFGPMDPEVFDTYIALTASASTFLYGKNLYAAMAVWETDPALAQQSPLTAEFAAIWQAAHKVVYSSSLTAPWTERTRIEAEFDAAAVQGLKAVSTGIITVGGAHLASQALDAGLVDECQLFVWPVIVGRGKPALQPRARVDLQLIDQRRFDNGVVLLRYRPLER